MKFLFEKLGKGIPSHILHIASGTTKEQIQHLKEGTF